MMVPNNHGFSYSKWSFWGVKWGYHHLRKHPYMAPAKNGNGGSLFSAGCCCGIPTRWGRPTITFGVKEHNLLIYYVRPFIMFFFSPPFFYYTVVSKNRCTPKYPKWMVKMKEKPRCFPICWKHPHGHIFTYMKNRETKFRIGSGFASFQNGHTNGSLGTRRQPLVDWPWPYLCHQSSERTLRTSWSFPRRYLFTVMRPSPRMPLWLVLYEIPAKGNLALNFLAVRYGNFKEFEARVSSRLQFHFRRYLDVYRVVDVLDF